MKYKLIEKNENNKILTISQLTFNNILRVWN